MRRIACVIALLFATACGSISPDCSLEFRGHSRKDVKLRQPEQTGYLEVATNVAGVLELCRQLQPGLQLPVSETEATDAEKRTVTLTGFVMAVRFESGPRFDQDFHIQISDSPKWEPGPHIVVEVPPGQMYCQARSKIAELVANETGPNVHRRTHIFKTPPHVELKGFLFFDAQHAPKNLNDCKTPKRGIGHPNMVESVWELHPVTSVRVLPQ